VNFGVSRPMQHMLRVLFTWLTVCAFPHSSSHAISPVTHERSKLIAQSANVVALTAADRAELRNWVSSLRSTDLCSFEVAEVFGWSSVREGDAVHRSALSKQRAEYVAHQLIIGGIPISNTYFAEGPADKSSILGALEPPPQGVTVRLIGHPSAGSCDLFPLTTDSVANIRSRTALLASPPGRGMKRHRLPK
jgi:hypothetical protein